MRINSPPGRMLLMGNSAPFNQPFKALPGLVALWPMQNNAALLDISGNAHNLAQHGSVTFGQAVGGGLYSHKLAAAYWNAADDVWNSITGALFIAGWINHDGNAAAQETYLAKWTSAGDQRCYALYRTNTGLLQWTVTALGTSASLIGIASLGAFTTGWTFVAGRYIPSTSVSNWINTTKANNTTTIPASLPDGTGAIEVGSWNGGASGMVGNMGVLGLYNIAPSDAAVLALYNTTKGFYINP